MSKIQWIVTHKLRLAMIYAIINTLLHLLIILMKIQDVDGLAIAIFMWLFEFPVFFVFEWLLPDFLVAGTMSYIMIQGVLAIITNSLIIIGFLAIVGKIFKVKKKPEIAE